MEPPPAQQKDMKNNVSVIPNSFNIVIPEEDKPATEATESESGTRRETELAEQADHYDPNAEGTSGSLIWRLIWGHFIVVSCYVCAFPIVKILSVPAPAPLAVMVSCPKAVCDTKLIPSLFYSFVLTLRLNSSKMSQICYFWITYC